MKSSLALAALLLCLAGCGSDVEVAAEPTPAPAPTTTELPEPGPEPRGELAPGELGVVDFAGEAAARPSTVRPNKDQVLRSLEWTGWGEDEATGRGTLEVLVCEPNCAQGQTEEVPATLTLSGPRTCGSRRFYGEATLRADDQEPAVFLRTPC